MDTKPESVNTQENFTVKAWYIPSIDGQPVLLSAKQKSPTLILGSNGSGKSALLLWLHANGDELPIVRIVGHRRIWLKTSSPVLDPSSIGIQHLTRNRAKPETRISTDFEDHGISQTLVKILDDFHNINNSIASSIRSTKRSATQVPESYFQKLTRIFTAAGLDLRLDWHSSIGIFINRGTEGVDIKVPITDLSDGEKSALLLGAEIISQPAGTIFLIDEPERHLHKNIASKLVLELIKVREDCAFIISSHDEKLAEDFLHLGHTLLVSSGVKWKGPSPVKWSLKKIEKPQFEAIPESSLKAILGGRQKIIFVEGQATSLDKKLYEALYPGFRVVPSGSCRNVIASTKGIAHSKDHHWLTAIAILDRDSRDESQVKRLQSESIQVLSVEEVECVLFSKTAVYAMSRILEENFDSSASSTIDQVESKLKDLFSNEKALMRLAKTTATKQVHHSAFDDLTNIALSDTDSDDLILKLSNPLPKVLNNLKALVAKKEWWTIIESYPVRDLGVPKQICDALGINETWYVGALLKRIQDNPDFKLEIFRVAGLEPNVCPQSG